MNKNKSAPIQVANAGYDVWMGNNRGNKYSRGHVKLNPDNGTDAEKREYFDYSFYELGKYDAPAQIDFVLKKTG